jgi:hypothetical protein
MNVNPAGRRPGQSQPSKDKDSPEEAREGQKRFALPKGKENGEKDEEKKKGLFDLNPEETAIQAPQTGVQQSMEEAALEKAAPAIPPATQVSQMGQIILKMVENMRIGQVGGKDFASLDLKTDSAVPQAFAGCNLNVSYEQNGIKIHFDNFMTPQQQNEAITLVEKNKEQLESMMQTLMAKNIQVTELTLGSHRVTLPRITALPPPFQASAPEQPEGGRQQQGKGDQGEKEKPKGKK